MGLDFRLIFKNPDLVQTLVGFVVGIPSQTQSRPSFSVFNRGNFFEVPKSHRLACYKGRKSEGVFASRRHI